MCFPLGDLTQLEGMSIDHKSAKVGKLVGK